MHARAALPTLCTCSYYFFDASASPLVFGICYAVTTTAMYAVVSALCVVDLLYLGSVFYLVALYEQLAHQIGELNGRGGRTTRRGQQLRACVQLHIDILRCVQRFTTRLRRTHKLLQMTYPIECFAAVVCRVPTASWAASCSCS